jgi:hypothetical protein
MKIALSVIFFHFAFVCFLFYFQTSKEHKEFRRPIAVRTHVQKNVVAKEMPKILAAVTKKKTSPSAEPVTKESTHQKKLVSLMQQSLAALSETETAPMKASLKTIGKLASDELFFETKYEEELILYLESWLTLPEKGEVKLKLTLKRDGSVEKIAILKATSERNSAYIESKLISLSFPRFDAHFKGENAHTFTITLKSENSR